MAFLQALINSAGTATNWFGHTDHRNDITDPPAVSLMEEKAGYAPKYVTEFAIGWTFDSASIRVSQGADNDGNIVAQQNFLDFNYKNGRQSGLILYTEPSTANDTLYGQAITLTAGDQTIDGRYSQQIFKFVPPSYQLTAEDQAATDSDELVISYGSNEVKFSTRRSVIWYENGIRYELLSNDLEALDKDDLLAMAQEVLAAR